MGGGVVSPNFLHPQSYDEQLFRLGVLLAQQTASRFGLELRIEETQQVLLRRLEADSTRLR